MPRCRHGWLVLGFVAAAGCGPDDLGPVPVVRDLTIENPTLAVGSSTAIRGSFTYTDGDSDIVSFFVRVTTPTSQTQTVGPSPASGVSNRRSGVLAFQFTLTAEHAGTYILELWVADEAGNESNRLSGTVTAS